jgi:hypothetical protein
MIFPKQLPLKIAFLRIPALLIALLGVNSGFAAKPPKFYPGISEDQSMRAHNALRSFYNGNLPRTERQLQELNLIEDHDSLPPLSRLLLVAVTGLYLQRDDAGTQEERARLKTVLDSAARKGVDRCLALERNRQRPGAATCLLIRGGIDGFRAVLKLNTASPVQVLSEGLDAVKLLEKGIGVDSLVRDAFLGMGIFHCTAANNSPRVVRSMLGAVGRRVNYEDGLAYLRRSGYEGQYTSTASQLYLIQFLSPYDDELRREKVEIFRTLQEVYPLSPYYSFLRWHEALVFYPDSFYTLPRLKTSLERRMRATETRDYAARRYLTLLKYQYTLLNPKPADDVQPDTTLNLGGYAFYPEFIEALRLRREIALVVRNTPAVPDTAQTRRLRALKEHEKSILKRIRKSELSGPNQRLYEWHVRDALRTPVRPGAIRPAATQP